MISYFRYFMYLMFVLVFTACGGGGGGGGGTPNTALSLSNNAVQFDVNQNGPLPSTQSITASWSNPDVVAILAGYPPNITPPTWLDLAIQGTASPVSISLSVNTTALTPGTYATTVRVVSVDSNANPVDIIDIAVSMNVQAKLGISGTTALTFNMVDTGLAPMDQSVSLIGDGISWNAVSSESWLQLGSTAGTAPSTVAIGIDPATLNAGIHTATVSFTDTTNTQTVTVDVELRVEPHKLLVADNGIALASMPGLSTLSATVAVNENAGVVTPWVASSSESWLAVTANGDTGNNLSISANPAGLAADTVHYATVTVTSGDTSIANSETIKVGFWVGATDPNASDSLALTYAEIATDPIRPYVYMHNQGAGIDVYNVHTAALVTTINNVGAQLGDMEVSTDGSILYVADLTNYDIVPVNLNTMTAGTAWDLTGSGSLWLGYGRVDNKSLVFSGNGMVHDADTGQALPASFTIASYTTGSVINVSQSGDMLCGVKTGLSPYSIECYSLDYSELGAGYLTMTSHGSVRGPGGNAKDVALVRDGSRAYVASGAPYNFIGFDTSTMLEDQTLPANAYPNSVEVSADNLLYGGTFTWYGSLTGDQDAWIYATDGVLQNSYYVSGYAKEIRDRQLVVSGDGLRMIISVTDPAIKILTTK